MAVDIEGIEFAWDSLKEKYLNDGDINEIAEYVRKFGVPRGEISNDIAEILIGKLKRRKQSSLPMQFVEGALKAQAYELKSGLHIEYNKAMADFIKLGLIKPLKPLLSDKSIRKIIAQKYYRGNLESARQAFHRVKKRHK